MRLIIIEQPCFVYLKDLELLINLYATYFRNCEFISDEPNSSNTLLNACKYFLSYPNYFEFIDHIQFHSVNNGSLYNDRTHNLFNLTCLLDAVIPLEMEYHTHIFINLLSFMLTQYIRNENNVDRKLQISHACYITLLDKKRLYGNKETFPNYDYTAKGISKCVGKVIKIKDNQFKTFRNMIPNLRNLKNKNNGNFYISYLFYLIKLKFYLNLMLFTYSSTSLITFLRI